MNQDIHIDRVSFQLGMINCFVEMVACGVKTLALSPPISPEDYSLIREYSDKIVEGFGIQSYLEKSLLITDLQPKEFTRGKWVIIYYEKDDVLSQYLKIKENQQDLEKAGLYDEKARKEIGKAFGLLLSYPEDKIEKKLAENKSPFMLVE
jgi:hypothetical protein